MINNHPFHYLHDQYHHFHCDCYPYHYNVVTRYDDHLYTYDNDGNDNDDNNNDHNDNLQSQAPPVWVSANVWEVGNTGSGISSGGSHFNDR